MNVKTIIAQNPFEEKDGVLYFCKPPADMMPSRNRTPSNARTWSYWRKQNYLFFEQELKALPKHSVLIDLGAGQSDFTELTGAFNLCAADLYPYPGISVVCDFEQHLPFKSASADAVLLANLLEHVREPNTLLAECHRILKPGGVLLGTVPFMIQIHQRPYDFYRYTHMNLEYLLKKHSFRNSQIIPVSSLYALLFNVSTSFFRRAIADARIKLPWRILWKTVRMGFAAFRGMFEKRSVDSDSPLGYLVKAYK